MNFYKLSHNYFATNNDDFIMYHSFRFSFIKNVQVFDPNLKKKKKKKKIAFDLDTELNEAGSNDDATEDTVDKENQEPEPTVIEDDTAMDLENFGKKKKKKKKVFNFDELEATLPDTKKEVRNNYVFS